VPRVRVSDGKYFNAMSKGCQREEDLCLILDKEAVGRSVGRLDCHHRRTMESALNEHAQLPTVKWIYWLIPRTRLLKANASVTLAWTVLWFSGDSPSRPGSTLHRLLTATGLALVAFDIAGAVTTFLSFRRISTSDSDAVTNDRREFHTSTRSATESRPAPTVAPKSTSAFTEQVQELSASSLNLLADPTQRPRVATAAMAYLTKRLETEPALIQPNVQLVRVGIAGVELLLADPCEQAPPGFSVTGGGLVWRLDAKVDLDKLLADETVGHQPPLTTLGDDDESTYFTVVDPSDPPYCDQLPSGNDNPSNASFAARFTAPFTLVETAEMTILEPFDLPLLPRDQESPSIESQDSLCNIQIPDEFDAEPVSLPDSGEAPVHNTCHDDHGLERILEESQRNGHTAAGGLVNESDGEVEHVGEVQTAQLPSLDLMQPGRVDVRIFRDNPVLEGALLAEPTPAAIEFVAYLVLHGQRATTVRLRDAIGSLKMQSSRSRKTVWSAASAARRAIGSDLLPVAAGNELYKLSSGVTCDWLRFQALLEFAKRPGANRDRCQQALSLALEMIDGIPAKASRRFLWLEDEGILGEITRAITIAAAMLALLELDGDSPERVRWALDKGLMVSPGDRQLLELEQRLGQRSAKTETSEEQFAEARIANS